MKKFLTLVFIALAAIAVLMILRNTSTKNTTTIGIIQTASHPALDLIRESFAKTIEKRRDDKITIQFQNAEGQISQARAIAKSFHADKNIKAIFTIATPATQAMTSIETIKPIIFSAVTDPTAIGIDNIPNVTGISDMINIPKSIFMLHTLLPNAHSVGILFNVREVNSVTLVRMMEEELNRINIPFIEIGINNEDEIASATSIACKKTDVILCPTDNTVAAAIDTIVDITNKAKIPLIVSDNLLIERGALAACGVDYSESGRNAAEMTIGVLLNGRSIQDFPIQTAGSEKITINKKVADMLGIAIPESLIENVI